MKKLILLIAFAVCLPLCFKEAAAADDGAGLMQIKLTANEIVITAVLNNTQTSKDFYERMPVELKMYPHQNREFYADMKLSKNAKTQNGYAVGDIGYWVAGGALVLFYDKGHTDGLILMGKMNSGWEKLTGINGSFTVLIEKIRD